MSEVGYLAPEGFVDELAHELGEVTEAHGRLLLAPGPVHGQMRPPEVTRSR